MIAKLVAAILGLLPALVWATHAPYDWEFICNEDSFESQYFFQKNYTNPVFLNALKQKRATANCPGEHRLKLTASTIQALRSNFQQGLKVYEKWKFTSPTRRAAGHLPGTQGASNFFLSNSEVSYLSVWLCNSTDRPINDSAFPIQIGGGVTELPGHTLYLAGVHELAHLHQNNNRLYIKQGLCEKAHGWISEGIAEHLGTQAANDKYGTDYHGPISNKFFRRFFLMRPYNVPLNLQAPGDAYPAAQSLLDYRTNGFWDFVSRNYLKNDYQKYQQLDQQLGRKELANQTGYVHQFLDGLDGKTSMGLKHVFPQFLTEYATWYKHRFKNHLRGSEALWMASSFGGCHKVALSTAKPAAEIDVWLDHYAGNCLEVRVEGLTASGEDLSVHVEANDSSGVAPEIVDQLYLGLAEMENSNHDINCYTALKTLDALSAPCLLDPVQGKNQTLMGRYWTTHAFQSNGAEPTIRLILSRVPQKIQDVGTSKDTQNISLRIGLSRATITTGGQKKKNAGAVHHQLSGVMNFEGNMHGNLSVKTAAGGTGAAGGSTTPPGMPGLPANMADLLKGRMKMPEVPTKNKGIQAFQIFETEKDRHSGMFKRVEGMITFKKGIQVGETGTFTGAGMITLPEGVAIDMVKGGSARLTLTRNDTAMLVYSGVINACVINPMAQQGCTRKVQLAFEGSTAFGGLMIGDNRLTEVVTPDYDAYKDLRIARISKSMGGASAGASASTTTGPGGAAGDSSASGDGTSGDAGCDCSCAALEAIKKDKSKLNPACLMSCLPQMMQCSRKR